MKNKFLLYFLGLFCITLFCSAYPSSIIKICKGTSYIDVAYTIRDNKICNGTSYTDVAYTIRGNEICLGTSYTNVAYTVRASNEKHR